MFRVVVISGAFLLAACQPKPTLVETKESIQAFGAFVDVTLINVPDKHTQLVLNKIRRDLKYFDFAFHPWKAGPTGRTNQLLEAAGEFTANPSLLPLIEKSQRYSALSQGLFNPAIGHLMQIWGFHDEIPPDQPPPDPADIQAWLDAKPSMDDLVVKGVRIRNSNPAVKLNFGAIAKGYALDVMIKHIQEMGVANAMISAGGVVKCLGQYGNGPWKIGIRHPRSEGEIASLEARDGEAVSTSGDDERFYEFEGQRYHHIIDPRSGYPADQAQSATVIHRDAALADAAATALFVAGPSQWLAIAKAMGIEQAMLIDNNGHILLTRAMQQRLHFEVPNQKYEILDLP
jgi:thiamine biosynthesis lipoprotein